MVMFIKKIINKGPATVSSPKSVISYEFDVNYSIESISCEIHLLKIRQG